MSEKEIFDRTVMKCLYNATGSVGNNTVKEVITAFKDARKDRQLINALRGHL